jgi:hypothetical protein
MPKTTEHGIRKILELQESLCFVKGATEAAIR